MEQHDISQDTSQNCRKRTASEVGLPDTTAPKVIKLLPQSDVHTIFCTICLKTITNETLGKPDACDHQFCLACILQWSKTKNSCPVDRERFRKIYFTNPSHGRYEGHVTVADIPDFEEEEEEEVQLCRVCTRSLDDLVARCLRCHVVGVHQACVGTTRNGAGENWLCDDCMISRGAVEVMAEAGLLQVEGEPAREPDLSPDEVECVYQYLEAVEQYLGTSEDRWSLQLRLATAASNVETFESLERMCELVGPENYGRGEKSIGIMGLALEIKEMVTDERLTELEGNDDALDEYIATAQEFLELVVKQEEDLRGLSVMLENRFKLFEGILDKILEFQAESDDDE